MQPKDLILGTPLGKLMKNNPNGTTKIHVVKLSDGSVQTLDTGVWSNALHYGNAYMKDDHTIVM